MNLTWARPWRHPEPPGKPLGGVSICTIEKVASQGTAGNQSHAAKWDLVCSLLTAECVSLASILHPQTSVQPHNLVWCLAHSTQ